MEDKRIYSLNLAAYLIMQGHIDYVIKQDSENLKFYFVFKDNEVGKDILTYKSDCVMVDLHQFSTSYRKLRREIDKIRLGDNHEA